MSLQNDEYGRRALAFVETVGQAETPEAIGALVLREMDWFGFTFVTSWTLPSVGGSQIECIDLNTRPEDYTEHYQRDGLLERDPVVTALRRDLRALSWSDVRQDSRFSRSELMVVEAARDFGAREGFTIPVITRSGCIGVFSPCGRDPDLSPRARAALELIGLYAHQALQRAAVRRTRAAKTFARLTDREREVMKWVAMGKTNDEIGDILFIQTSTVKTILGRACAKLDATRRSYAVVQAIRLGELDLNF